jgi:peptidyl-Asp metalloendopeptidase
LTAVTDFSSCGRAHINSLKDGWNIGVVHQSCATGSYSFAHEIAHMFGAHHNREVIEEFDTENPTAYGYLIQPPVNSGYRTIMA